MKRNHLLVIEKRNYLKWKMRSSCKRSVMRRRRRRRGWWSGALFQASGSSAVHTCIWLLLLLLLLVSALHAEWGQRQITQATATTAAAATAAELYSSCSRILPTMCSMEQYSNLHSTPHSPPIIFPALVPPILTVTATAAKATAEAAAELYLQCSPRNNLPMYIELLLLLPIISASFQHQ